MDKNIISYIYIALGIILLVITLGVPGLIPHLEGVQNDKRVLALLLCVSLFLIILGVTTGMGSTVKSFKVGLFSMSFFQPSTESKRIYSLSSVEKKERQEYSRGKSIPGDTATPFSAFNVQSLVLKTLPCADPMTPMYMLDKEYRIIDWNDAFSLAFNYSMEGMQGITVLEWVYVLENYKEVIDHGVETFSVNEPPRFDKEIVKFKNEKYGLIVGTKRCYQIPGDNEECIGWLMTIELTFDEKYKSSIFLKDLFAHLRKSYVWSEYALSYDNVLNNTKVYPELLDTMLLGVKDKLVPIPGNTRVLDLGAGTGNVTKRLIANDDKLVVALEKNPIMLKYLHYKCAERVRYDDNDVGVIIVKQDIVSLTGIKDNYFDFVIMNNVLYSIEDKRVIDCLREVYRVLKPQGEVRISGPHKKTNLKKLFKRIMQDLKQAGNFGEKEEEEFYQVKAINEYLLAPMLFKWNAKDVEQILIEGAGFETISFSTEMAYAGQAMIVCARK